MVIQQVKKNQINVREDNMIQKLQSEINYLKDLLQLKKKGKNDELTNQLYTLKQENKRLRRAQLTNQDIEQMMRENREMKI